MRMRFLFCKMSSGEHRTCAHMALFSLPGHYRTVIVLKFGSVAGRAYYQNDV